MPTGSATDELALTKAKSDRAYTYNRILWQLFTAVVAHCLILQSEAQLFRAACGGNLAKTSRATSLTAAIVGVASLFVNQVLANASDCIGRKTMFLLGPVMNVMVGLAVFLKPKSLTVLSVGRVVKQVCTTLSGSVMCIASARDILPAEDLAKFFGDVGTSVGLAVLLSPILEGIILKCFKGDYRYSFLALVPLSIATILSTLMMPETLKPEKRASWSEFTVSLSSLNPMSFVRIFQTKNRYLKQLSLVEALQYSTEGRNTSDFFQLWSRNHCGMDNALVASTVAYWGTVVTFGGIFVSPWMLRTFGARSQTLFANMCVGTALAAHGFRESALFIWLPTPFLVPGVNGNNCQRVKALAMARATEEEGFNNGEFTAMQTNMRAINNAIVPVVLGRYYAFCLERGIYGGTTWFIAAALGAYIPSLYIVTCMSKEAWEMPNKKAH